MSGRPYVDVEHVTLGGKRLGAIAKLPKFPVLTPKGRYYLEADEATQLKIAEEVYFAMKDDNRNKTMTSDPKPVLQAIIRALKERG